MNQEITPADIGTPCGIIPFHIAHEACWPCVVGGDYEYYKAVQTFASSGMTMLDAVIYRVRPSTS
jgi:hypothetical protein